MRAYFVVPGKDGGVFELRDTKPPEALGPMAVIDVRAAGLNRGELLTLAVFRSDNRDLKPYPAGIEFAGEIVEVGPDATGWHIGERVMGRFPGAYSERLAVLSSMLYRIPDGLSWPKPPPSPTCSSLPTTRWQPPPVSAPGNGCSSRRAHPAWAPRQSNSRGSSEHRRS